MAKQNNIMPLIIGIIIIALLINFQSPKVEIEEIEMIDLTPHYYKNGVEVFPTKGLSSISTTITSPKDWDWRSFWIICIDRTMPSAPSNLAITSSGQDIILTWDTATDEPSCSHIKHYVISRDGNPIASINATTFTDIDISYGDYSYSVYAVDAVDHLGPSIKKNIMFSSDGIFETIDYNEYNQVSFDVLVINVGNVNITNLQIADAYPIEFKNALPKTIQSSLEGGESKKWSSSLMDLTSSSQLFWVNVSGEDATNKIYKSSSVYLIKKGMEFTSITSDKGTCGIVDDEWKCDISIYAGESYYLDLILQNSGSVISQPTLIEVVISNFDGIGMTVDYLNDNLNSGIAFDVPYCIIGEDAYYYIGTSDGFVFPSGYSENSRITVHTANNLMPGDYDTNTNLILASEQKCFPSQPACIDGFKECAPGFFVPCEVPCPG